MKIFQSELEYEVISIARQKNLSFILLNVLVILSKDNYVIPNVAISQVISLLHSVQLRIPRQADELVRIKGKRLSVIAHSGEPNALELQISGFNFYCQ